MLLTFEAETWRNCFFSVFLSFPITVDFFLFTMLSLAVQFQPYNCCHYVAMTSGASAAWQSILSNYCETCKQMFCENTDGLIERSHSAARWSLLASCSSLFAFISTLALFPPVGSGVFQQASADKPAAHHLPDTSLQTKVKRQH